MARVTFVTEEPITLEGYQAILKPSKFGYSLATTINQEMIDKLVEDRIELVKWCESKLKNPKRSVGKPEPWEEVSNGVYKIKFSWNKETKPYIVDSGGFDIDNPELPLYSGSKVKIVFFQMPYVLKDCITYGTTLKILGVQVISLNAAPDKPIDDRQERAEVMKLLGTCDGYRVEPETLNWF